MNVTQIRQFTAAARLESVPRTTQLPHVTQAAPSKNVAQPERYAPRMLRNITKIRAAARKTPPEDR